MKHPARLTIDLEAIQENYRMLHRMANTHAAAVVKADAYGLGMCMVAPALARAGCSMFYVAYPEEGITLRRCLQEHDLPGIIVVLNGLNTDTFPAFIDNDLWPVCNTMAQVLLWQAHGSSRPAILQMETGMHRAGLPVNHWHAAARAGLNIRTLISHLACADTPQHPLNQQQLSRLKSARRLFPRVPLSLAASYGVVHLPETCLDSVRLGAALYGGIPHPCSRAIVTLEAQVLEIRTVAKGATVGYGATWQAPACRRIATLALGYADGLHRLTTPGAHVRFGTFLAPVIGRISMDLLTVDVSDVPARYCYPQAWASVIDKHNSIHHWAETSQTIGYEVLTSLGSRYQRRYTGDIFPLSSTHQHFP